jgi:hypothetical protein
MEEGIDLRKGESEGWLDVIELRVDVDKTGANPLVEARAW